MPERTKTESVVLKIDLYQKPGRVELVVIHTPAPLWDLLPLKAQHIPDDSIPSAYFKRFTARAYGKLYELTFYHVPRRP